MHQAGQLGAEPSRCPLRQQLCRQPQTPMALQFPSTVHATVLISTHGEGMRTACQTHMGTELLPCVPFPFQRTGSSSAPSACPGHLAPAQAPKHEPGQRLMRERGQRQRQSDRLSKGGDVAEVWGGHHSLGTRRCQGSREHPSTPAQRVQRGQPDPGYAQVLEAAERPRQQAQGDEMVLRPLLLRPSADQAAP